MEQYCRELEALITDVLLPAYLEHSRLTGKPDPLKGINANLAAMKSKRKIPYLLQRQNYGPTNSKQTSKP